MMLIQKPNSQITTYITQELKEKVHDYILHAFAKNTLINYQSDWKLFCKWCDEVNFSIESINYHTLIIYITHLADKNYKSSTIQRKISAITKTCKLNNKTIDINHNEFKLVWQGIRRKHGTAKKGKDPLLIATIKLMLDAIPNNTPMGIRDRAIISFGWASAMRRSELVNLNWQDLKFVEEGVVVTIKQSKTDKFSEGQKIAVLYGRSKATCPVINLLKWKQLSYLPEDSPVFSSVTKSGNLQYKRLSNIDIARIIKKVVRSIGLDEDAFAGHSLRSGIVTTAAKNAVPTHVIMKHTRHTTSQMIDVYTRDKSLIDDNMTGMVGL